MVESDTGVQKSRTWFYALEDYLLDASVRRKLDVIRKRYVENNRRLI